MLDIARPRLPDVPLHVADMRDFGLGRQFDVVTCLFSSIGAMTSFDDLLAAFGTMARHLTPGGLLIVDPWLTPDRFDPTHLSKPLVASGDGFHIVRMSETSVHGRVSSLNFHYLLGTPGHVRYFTETLELALYTRDEYRDAFLAAGLSPEFDEQGLMGRGRWIAIKPDRAPRRKTV